MKFREYKEKYPYEREGKWLCLDIFYNRCKILFLQSSLFYDRCDGVDPISRDPGTAGDQILNRNIIVILNHE